MKRSRKLTLVLMTAVPVALGGCQSEPTGEVVQSVAQCEAGGWMSREQCQAAHDEALAAHATSAPRFESQADCEAEFGQCTPQQEGTQEGARTSYMPPMSGFLIGYLLAGSMGRNTAGNLPANQAARPPGASGGAGYAGAAPLYRSRSRGEFFNARGDFVSNHAGAVSGARGVVLPPGRAVTVSRGGFGARGAFTGGRGS